MHRKKQDCYSDVPIVIQGVSIGGAIAINACEKILNFLEDAVANE